MSAPAMTVWRNPTDSPQTVTFQTGETRIIGRRVDPDFGVETNAYSRPTFETFVVPPGGTAEIPSVYDGAIHRVHDGAVIGGMAPLLIRAGQTYGIDPAMIPAPEPRRMSVSPSELAERLRGAASAPKEDAMTRARSKKGGADGSQ